MAVERWYSVLSSEYQWWLAFHTQENANISGYDFQKLYPQGALAAQQQWKPFPSVLFILCNNSILLIYGLDISVMDRLLKCQWMGQKYINILAALVINPRLCWVIYFLVLGKAWRKLRWLSEVTEGIFGSEFKACSKQYFSKKQTAKIDSQKKKKMMKSNPGKFKRVIHI